MMNYQHPCHNALSHTSSTQASLHQPQTQIFVHGSIDSNFTNASSIGQMSMPYKQVPEQIDAEMNN